MGINVFKVILLFGLIIVVRLIGEYGEQIAMVFSYKLVDITMIILTLLIFSLFISLLPNKEKRNTKIIK